VCGGHKPRECGTSADRYFLGDLTPARLPAIVVAMLALVMVGLCMVVDLVNEPADRAQAMMGWGSVSACIGAIAVATQESAP
jgi:hypothetical protein